MTFVSALWRNASPLAAPSATFTRRFQDKGWKYDPPAKSTTLALRASPRIKNLQFSVTMLVIPQGVVELGSVGAGRVRRRGGRTSEEVVLQAPPGHELVDEQPMLVLQAVPEQLDEVGVVQLTKVVDFSLQFSRGLPFRETGWTLKSAEDGNCQCPSYSTRAEVIHA